MLIVVAVTHNVTRARRPDRTICQFHELREFVDSATALHFPDTTPVRCVADWDGARADELGLSPAGYAVHATPVDRSWRGHVYSISVEPYA